MPKKKWSVHEGHCCVIHGCKYGDRDCPVVAKLTKQAYLCESCDHAGITSLAMLEKVLKGKVKRCQFCGHVQLPAPKTKRGVELTLDEMYELEAKHTATVGHR